MPSRIQIAKIRIAKPDILKSFENAGKKVFWPGDVAAILRENRSLWRLPMTTTAQVFIEFLLAETALQKVQLVSENYRDVTRYTWGAASPYEIALSLARGAYLTHGTAVSLHALNDQVPNTIYVNREQSPKPISDLPPIQERINLAFSRQQRTSNYTFLYDNTRIVLVSGKNTGRVEVGAIQASGGEFLACTKLERTLIDIVVRPAYAGGIFQVFEAYKRAKDRASANVLVATLKKLAYVYPYHQAIGFLMERAGFDVGILSGLKRLGLEFDFFLVHGGVNTKYDSTWRIHYPEGL